MSSSRSVPGDMPPIHGIESAVAAGSHMLATPVPHIERESDALRLSHDLSGTYNELDDDEDNALDHTLYNLTDREQRGAFTYRLLDISQAVGPATVRTGVLPKCIQLLQYEDSVGHLAQQLAELIALGGGMKHFSAFTQLVEATIVNVDPAVSREAVDGVRSVIERFLADTAALDQEKQAAPLVALITQLSTSQYSAGRAAAAALYADIYRITDDAAALEAFATLCHDRQVQVRRAAVSSLATWATAVSGNQVKTFVLPQVDYFSHDQMQDSVRVDLVGQLADVGKAVAVPEQKDIIIPLICRMASDRSWRVRYIVAKHLGSFVSCFSSIAEPLIDCVVSLSEDEEVEVRAVTATQLELVCSALPSSLVESKIVPQAVALAEDSELTVKAAIAGTICQIAHCCSKAKAEQKLLPPIINLLHDKEERVRCNLLEHIPSIAQLLESRSVSESLVKELVSAMTSPKWRVRQAVVRALRQFSFYLTQATFEPLKESTVLLLVDDVHAVRSATVGTITVLSKSFGSKWSLALLDDLRKRYATDTSYQRRAVFLSCFEGLSPHVEPKHFDAAGDVKKLLEETISKLTTDQVANVRCACGKALTTLQMARGGIMASICTASLHKLRADKDPQVVAASTPVEAEAPF